MHQPNTFLRSRTRRRAGLAAAVALVAGAASLGGPPALASGGSYTAPSHYGGCGNAVDPLLSVGSRLLSPDTTGRGYDAIESVSVGASNTTSASTPAVGQESFSVQLCAPLPTFPVAYSNGEVDGGVLIEACVDPNTAIVSSPEYIGTGNDGGPIYDGPYPPGQGYRWCTFYSHLEYVPDNWGVAIYDPAGAFITFDSSQLVDLSGASTMCAPTVASDTITLCLPDALVQANTNLLQVEPFVTPGSTVHDWSVTVADVLDPSLGEALVTQPVVTDSAPGVQWCTTPAIACGVDSGNAWDNGFVLGTYPVLSLEDPAQGVATCALSWSYFAQLASPSWGALRGQGGWPSTCSGATAKLPADPGGPYYQGSGNLCPPSCANPGTAVPKATFYSSVYGRGPNPELTPGYHIFAQFNFDTGNDYGPSA